MADGQRKTPCVSVSAGRRGSPSLGGSDSDAPFPQFWRLKSEIQVLARWSLAQITSHSDLPWLFLRACRGGLPPPLSATHCLLGAPPHDFMQFCPEGPISGYRHTGVRASAEGWGHKPAAQQARAAFSSCLWNRMCPSRGGRRHFVDSAAPIENGPVGPVCSPPTPASPGSGPLVEPVIKHGGKPRLARCSNLSPHRIPQTTRSCWQVAVVSPRPQTRDEA